MHCAAYMNYGYGWADWVYQAGTGERKHDLHAKIAQRGSE